MNRVLYKYVLLFSDGIDPWGLKYSSKSWVFSSDLISVSQWIFNYYLIPQINQNSLELFEYDFVLKSTFPLNLWLEASFGEQAWREESPQNIGW